MVGKRDWRRCVEERVNWLIDKVTPIDELVYIYPLLIVNFLNSLAGLIYRPVFYEPNRFCGILALFFFGIVLLGAVRSARNRGADAGNP